MTEDPVFKGTYVYLNTRTHLFLLHKRDIVGLVSISGG